MKKLMIVFLFIGMSLYAIERWAGWYMVVERKCVPLSQAERHTPDKKAWCGMEYGPNRLILDCGLNRTDYRVYYYYFSSLKACKEWVCDGCPGQHYVGPPDE